MATAMFRRSLFAVLCMVLSTAFMYSASYAKDCDGTGCNGVKIYNHTDEEYKIQFLLCCDYTYKLTDCYLVPLDGVSLDFGDCSLLKFGFCSALPRGVCAKWYEDECIIRIVYCTP